MRRLLLILLSTSLFVSLSFSQQKGPYMNFKTKQHDFGTIYQEKGPVRYVFEFVNTGSRPVIIKDVKSSCGCTTPSWTKKPIPPGAKGQITVEYDPRNRPGAFLKTVTVYSNAKNSPVVLQIKGFVQEKQNPVEEQYPYDLGNGLRVSKRFVNFGPIYNDQVRTKQIKIYNYSSADINVKPAVRRLPTYLKVDITPATIKPKSTATMHITFDARKAHNWDYTRARIFLIINDNLNLNKWIDASAIIKERFSEQIKKNPPIIKFDTNAYDFGTIEQGQVVDHEFKFKNVGTGPLLIRKVKTSCGCTTTYYTRDTIPPGGEGTLKVRFNSAHKMGKQVKVITVITNSPETTKVILRLTGNVVKPKKESKK